MGPRIWKSNVGYDALRAADGRDNNESGTLFRHPDKSDRASIWRKGRTDIVSRVRSQLLRFRRSNELDVNVEIVLLRSIPGKCHLIAVRGKAGGSLKTRITGEWHHFGCRRRFSGSPAKDPSGDGDGHDNERCPRPNPAPPSFEGEAQRDRSSR